MKKLTCEIKLLLEEKLITAEEIFEYVVNKLEKHTISYGKEIIYTNKYKNGDLFKTKIETDNEISTNITGMGIYFILNERIDKILYVGKSEILNDRLKQHLIECPASTSSHIQDVIKYLLQENSNNKVLKYCVINTNGNNAAIEELLITHLKNSSNLLFSENWNRRKG
jgi:hypothetical protein